MASSGFKAVCFDLFHTLVDVGNVPESVGRSTADVLGVSRQQWNAACFSDAHEIRAPSRHRDIVQSLAHSLDPGISMQVIDDATRERQRRFDHALMAVEPTVLALLARLKQDNLKLALISNASTGEVSAWPDSPLSPLFETAIFSCQCGYAKPEPGIYHTALEQIDVIAEECLFIGDGGSDEHRGAREAGMHTVLLTRHVRKRLTDEELQRRASLAHHVIHYLEEITLLLDGKRA
jgi:putative hydrolase of the HAD superfamily